MRILWPSPGSIPWSIAAAANNGTAMRQPVQMIAAPTPAMSHRRWVRSEARRSRQPARRDS